MRVLAVGALAFLLFCAALAPAGLFAVLIERLGGASLNATAGTVWSGSGELRLSTHALGRLHWSFNPSSLAQFAPGFAWQLTGPGLDAHGQIAVRVDGVQLSGRGRVGTALVNAGLANYDIRLGGEFDIEGIDAIVLNNRLTHLEGAARWSGGQVSYALARQSHTALLPPMRAEAHSPPVRAEAYSEAEGALLMEAEVLEGGYVRVGITRRLLRWLDQPWAGDGADDEVVIAVEEAIF